MISPFSNHYNVAFKEFSIDSSGDFYSISEEMMNNYGDLNEDNRQYRYGECLRTKLFSIATSELKSCLTYHLDMINDKLDWLRNLNGLLNNISELTDNHFYIHNNRKPLLNLISECINETKVAVDFQYELDRNETNKHDKLLLNISVPQFAGLMCILFEEGVFKEVKSQAKMYKMVSSLFFKKDGTPISAHSFKNHYLIKSGNNYDKLHGIFVRSSQNAHKKKSIQ